MEGVMLYEDPRFKSLSFYLWKCTVKNINMGCTINLELYLQNLYRMSP